MDGPIQKLVVTKVSGESEDASSVSFSRINFYPQPSDVPGCCGVIASTGGKMVYDFIWLSFYFYEDTAVGQDLKFERLLFGMPYSSNSADYTANFSGRMILKEMTGKRAVIRMQDVRFKIAHGEFVLNGDLVAKVK